MLEPLWGEQSDTTNRFELVCLYVSSSVVCHADIFAKGNVEQQIAVGMMANKLMTLDISWLNMKPRTHQTEGLPRLLCGIPTKCPPLLGMIYVSPQMADTWKRLLKLWI